MIRTDWIQNGPNRIEPDIPFGHNPNTLIVPSEHSRSIKRSKIKILRSLIDRYLNLNYTSWIKTERAWSIFQRLGRFGI